MKKLLLLLIPVFIFAQTQPLNGLERASDRYKRDSCQKAKAIARENYNIVDMNVGCNCEKSDAREWMCFIRFTYLPKETQK